jgi:drug/metabolite transporter (DMT)-like permease
MARSRLIAAFAAVYLIWGSTFLALALGLQSIPPLLLMGARSIAAGAILLAIEQVRRPGFPSGRAWASASVSGLLLFVGCHGTLAYAQQYVSSGLAAVMLATVPFWIVLLNVSAPGDPRAKMLTFAGLLPGLAGVALIAWPEDSGAPAAIDPLMLLLLLASAFFWAAGSLLSQRQQAATSAISLAGMQLVCGGAALLVGSGLGGELRAFSPGNVSAISWAGLSYLIGAGSVIGFTAYMWLLDHAPGPLVATYTFVNPIIAVILGWRFLDERLTPQMLAGTALVVGSVAAVWRLNSRPVPRERSARADQA